MLLIAASLTARFQLLGKKKLEFLLQKTCTIHINADFTQLYHSFAKHFLHWIMYNATCILFPVLALNTVYMYIKLNKSAVLLFGNQQTCEYLQSMPSLYINDKLLPVVTEAKIVGLVIDPSFSYKLTYLFVTYSINVIVWLYRSLHIPLLCMVTPSIPRTKTRIQKVQHPCLRYVFNIRKYDHITSTNCGSKVYCDNFDLINDLRNKVAKEEFEYQEPIDKKKNHLINKLKHVCKEIV